MDGIRTEIEAFAPHQGDGNKDGVADSLQATVASVRLASTGDFVTIDAGDLDLSDVQAVDASGIHPEGMNLPYGLFSFTLTDLAPGGAATVRMLLPVGAHPAGYFKVDPNSGAFSRFEFDGTTGAAIAGNIVTLHFVDGGRGDADGQANGVIVDPGGPGTSPFSCSGGFDGWTIVESGGSTSGKGTVVSDDEDIVLTEGDSFLVAIERTFTVPSNPSAVALTYHDLTFDDTDTDAINDAFEVALVSTTGFPLLSTIGGSTRDAAFNVTEEVIGAALGAETTHTGTTTTVSLDISKLVPGSTAKIIVRLVNNDSDEETTVRLPEDSPIIVTTSEPTSDEGESMSLQANFSDCGTANTYSVTTAWGDGISNAATVSTSGSTVTIDGGHIYADDGPYEATLAITTTGDGTANVAVPVAVNNVAPTLTTTFDFEVITSSDGVARLDVVIDGSFTDPGFNRPAAGSFPGTTESFTVTVDWGDGTAETVSATVTQGSDGVQTSGLIAGSGAAHHTYFRGGIYTATVTVNDDNGGSDLTEHTYGVVRIDVKPIVNLADPVSSLDYLGTIPVVVFSDPRFDALRIDPATLAFGPGEAPEAQGAIHPHDEPPDDGYTDALTHFHILDTDFPPLDFVLGTGALLTGALVDGTPFAGVDTLGVLPDTLEQAGEILGTKQAATNTKFFVVDPSADKVFKYQATGAGNGSFTTSLGIQNARGVAASVAGDRIWVVNNDTVAPIAHDVTVQTPTGITLGQWTATDLVNPQGIATNGVDLWILDVLSPGPSVLRQYTGGAARITGSATANSSCVLHVNNGSASDVTTNGLGTFWITDDGTDEVFVYSTLNPNSPGAWTYEGRWRLDPFNADPSGITLNPAGGNDLWVLDRIDRAVYHYGGAMLRRDGIQAYNGFL